MAMNATQGAGRSALQAPFDAWAAGIVAADVASASRAGAQSLAARRQRRLAELLSSTVRDSRLYRRLLKGRDPAAWSLHELPIARKPDLMRDFDDWVTDPEVRLDELRRFTADRSRIGDPYLGRYVVWESSGSSGKPGIFVQDKGSMAVYDSLEALRRPPTRSLRRLLDPWYLSERIVFIGATSGHFASTVTMRRLRRLNPALSDRVHELSFLLPIDRLVAELHALSPTIIATYPSAAMLLAEERMAGRLELALQEVWTGGEALTSGMRGVIRQSFGCPVTNDYGASEFLALASECSRGRLHLNSDWAILEPVDERGLPVPAGVAGATTLLTNLANHVQPLIRYDVGDRVRLHAPACACGSRLPVIDVEGRNDDMLRLGRPGGRVVVVLPLALTTVLEDEAGLFDFQLVQQGPCELLLRTGMRGEVAELALRRAGAAVANFLARQGVDDVQIHYRSGEPGRLDRSGKLQRVANAEPGSDVLEPGP